MSGGASFGGDARVRIFCALTLPDEAIERLVEWQRKLPRGDFRLVPPGNLHITLAFLGHRPEREIDPIARELAGAARTAAPISLAVRRYRETRAVGMLVCDDAGAAGGMLAVELWERLERLGVYRREARPWLPHLAVSRFRKPPRLAPEVPELELVPSGAAVYLSRLRPTGAEYVVVQKFGLGRGPARGKEG
jgi:2'-5' RNA ligase